MQYKYNLVRQQGVSCPKRVFLCCGPPKLFVTSTSSPANALYLRSNRAKPRSSDSKNANSCQLEIKMELEICSTGRKHMPEKIYFVGRYYNILSVCICIYTRTSRLSLVVNVAKTRKKLPLSVASRRKEMISLGFLYLSYRQHSRLDVRVCVCTQLIAQIYGFVCVCVCESVWQ